jgi:hypothetical protein
MLETLVHLWCHQELLGGRLLVISTLCVVLVPWLARELQHRSDNAALCGAKKIKYCTHTKVDISHYI